MRLTLETEDDKEQNVTYEFRTWRFAFVSQSKESFFHGERKMTHRLANARQDAKKGRSRDPAVCRKSRVIRTVASMMQTEALASVKFSQCRFLAVVLSPLALVLPPRGLLSRL